MNYYQDYFFKSNDIYLLNHSVGCMPGDTREQLEQTFIKPWENAKPDAWNQWMSVFSNFQIGLATLFNSAPGAFCPQSNVSSSLNKFINSLPAPSKNKNVILLCEHDFPSMGFCLEQAQRLGFRLRFLPEEHNPQALETWEQALGSDVHTALITHVHYDTSRRIPARKISTLCAERDIFSIVDVSQSAGVVPISLDKWQASCVIGSCVKWLCGGPGAGFLWINPDLVSQLKPTDVGWFSHENPFEFDIHHFKYASDSRRFWGGTPSVIPFAVAANSLQLINSIGVKTIAEHNRILNQQMIDQLPSSYLVTPLESKKRGGTLVVNPPDIDRAEKALQDANVSFDRRAPGLRFSPHIYNTPEDMACVIECLQQGATKP